MRRRAFEVFSFLENILSSYIVLAFLTLLVLVNLFIPSGKLKISDDSLVYISTASKFVLNYFYFYLFACISVIVLKVLFSDAKNLVKYISIISFVFYAFIITFLYSSLTVIIFKFMSKDGVDISVFANLSGYLVLIIVVEFLKFLFGVNDMASKTSLNIKLVDTLTDKYNDRFEVFDSDVCADLIKKYGGNTQ